MSNTNKKIALQWERLDQKKKKLMDLIHSLPDETYLRQPDAKTWSVGQIANHLYLSERASLAYLKKKLSYPETLLPYHIKSWWSLYFVNFVLWSPIKIKAPAAINMWQGLAVLSPQDLELKWNSVREELKTFLALHQPKYSTHLVYNHPLSGRMTMKQMLIFFNHHMAHHTRQMERILRRKNFDL